MNHGVLRGHMLRQDLYPDDPSLDASDHAPGPVTTYTLTPEEIESRYGPKGEIEMPKGAPFGDEVKAKASDMFRAGMTDQYIAHSLKISVPTANNWRQAYRAGTLIRTQRPKKTDVPSIEVAEEKHAAAQDEARKVLTQQEAIDTALSAHDAAVAEEQRVREEEAQAQRERDHELREIENRDTERERELAAIIAEYPREEPTTPQTFGAMTVVGAVREESFAETPVTRAAVITKREALDLYRLCMATGFSDDGHHDAREKLAGYARAFVQKVFPIAERVLLGDETR